MAKTLKVIQVPFDPKRGLVFSGPTVPNFEFSDVLKIVSLSPTTSSAEVYFVSVITGLRYNMYLSDFNYLIQHVPINKSTVTGKFTFTKKNRYFGIKLVLEDDK